MFLKKDNQKNRNKKYMKLALKLASERVGLTGTNPSVGCVIVKDNEVISVGQTSFSGRPHAEYNAIVNADRKKIKGSTMYVSLEPCTHFGKTNPCTDIIIKSKIRKLYYAIDDVDFRTSKKAKKKLNNGNVVVVRNFLKHEAKKIYYSYFFNKMNKYPYVTGKIASSKDNFSTHKDKQITNVHSQRVSHLLRFKNQGILITSKTCNLDNPSLNCRLNGLEKFSPIKFILDKDLKINLKSNVVKNSKNEKTYIFYNTELASKKMFLRKSGVSLIKIDLGPDNNMLISNILRYIKNIGIYYLLIEGGSTLTKDFLDKSIFNEFYLFKSNSKLLKKGKNNIRSIISNLNFYFKNKKKLNTFLDDDIVINYR